MHVLSIGTMVSPFGLFAKSTKSRVLLKVLKTEINAGLEKPLQFLHVSDSHNVVWDDREPKQQELYKQRVRTFANATKYWNDSLEYAKSRNLPILHTGDLCDFYNSATLDFLKSNIRENIFAYAVGNHELSMRYGTFRDGLPTDEMKKNMENSLGYDVDISSKIIGGLNIISLNNGYYQFTEHQLNRLNEEIKRGLPILVLCHIPIYSKEFWQEDHTVKTRKISKSKKAKHKKVLASVVGAPVELLQGCDTLIFEHRKPTSTTANVVEILQTNPLIKGILCGHVHHTISAILPSGAVQTCIDGGYNGWVNEVIIK